MHRQLLVLVCALGLLACGGGDPVDAGGGGMDGGGGADGGGGDTGGGGGGTDGGGTDGGAFDAGDFDAGDFDAGSRDGGGTPVDAGACGAMDATEDTPCGPTERPGVRYVWNGTTCEFAAWCHCAGADCGTIYATEDACLAAYRSCLTPCTSDADCTAGSAWCEGGVCVGCDNSGLLCDIACGLSGWATYERNGCHPCECGPPNECGADGDCRTGQHCYAGAFCWCPGGTRSPDCCLGNVCAATGCPEPPTTGCESRGCPSGQTCSLDMADGCAPSRCTCETTGSWACTRDCGGGVCVTP
ncbi:MAG: hypothetical protein H6719_15385 [Sandaracinaceae bacterium]|nr:hypothetical protein [Sandaracinaceae bacterium]